MEIINIIFFSYKVLVYILKWLRLERCDFRHCTTLKCLGSWGILAVSVRIPMVSGPSGPTPPLNSQKSHLLLATVSHLLCDSNLHHIQLILQLTFCLVPGRHVFVLCLFPFQLSLVGFLFDLHVFILFIIIYWLLFLFFTEILVLV